MTGLHRGVLAGVSAGVLLSSCVEVNAQISLQPAAGKLSASYEHTFTHAGVADPSAALSGVNATQVGTNSFYYGASSPTTAGIVSYGFAMSPPPDKPDAALRSLIVIAHSHDFDATTAGHCYGEFTLNATGPAVVFFDTDGVLNDHNNVVRRDLADFTSLVGGGTSLEIAFKAMRDGSGSSTSQQLLGAHTGAVRQWTLHVSAVYQDAQSRTYAVPIVNPSFEGPDLTVVDPGTSANWTEFPEPWITTSTSEFQVNRPPSSAFTVGMPDGSQIGNLYAALEQSLGPTAANTRYALSFWLGSRIDETGDDVTVELLDNGVIFAAGTFSPPSGGATGAFEMFSLAGSSPSSVQGALSIRFERVAPYDSPVFLDAVSMTATPFAVGTVIIIR